MKPIHRQNRTEPSSSEEITALFGLKMIFSQTPVLAFRQTPLMPSYGRTSVFMLDR